jgi:hypothetical protein
MNLKIFGDVCSPAFLVEANLSARLDMARLKEFGTGFPPT